MCMQWPQALCPHLHGVINNGSSWLGLSKKHLYPTKLTKTDHQRPELIPSLVSHKFILSKTDSGGSSGRCSPPKSKPPDLIGKPLQKTFKSTRFYPDLATIRPLKFRSGHVWPFSALIHLNPMMFNLDFLKVAKECSLTMNLNAHAIYSWRHVCQDI